MDANWMERGLCRDIAPSVFFPSDGVGVEIARAICADCPVSRPCLEYALENKIDHGVWGGCSERSGAVSPASAGSAGARPSVTKPKRRSEARAATLLP